MSSRDQDQRAKQEGDLNDSKLIKASSTSRQWAGFRNPRIVRVSRSFGGKDRHSKVCTVRGLRDRRIRLSVPTAIQLYDLQDKLGLSQPSKVVDWLLDATKNEIDKLPPLQMPPGNLSQFFQPLVVSQQSSSSAPQSSITPRFFDPNSYIKEGIKINDGNDQTVMDRSKYWIPHGDSSRKMQAEKDKWIASNEQGNQEGSYGGYASPITAQNFFPIVNQSSFHNNLLTNALPYNSYYQLEASSSLSLSQFGSINHISNQEQDQSHMAFPTGSHQVYFCPSAATVPAIINPSLPSFATMESSSDPRQINHFQILSSSTSQQLLQNPLIPTLHFIGSPMKSLALNVDPKILHPQETDGNEGGSSS